MQFTLERVSSLGVRIGKILWSGALGPGVLDTPLCLPYTRAGAVPSVVHSVLQDVEPSCRPPCVLLPLPTLYELPGTEILEEYGQGLHHFLKLNEHFLYLSIQDPANPQPPRFNAEKNTSVWTTRGRHKVTAEDFVRFVAAGRPNVFECLCDTVSSQEHELKRVKKSVDRTLKFLDQIISAREGHEVSANATTFSLKVGQFVAAPYLPRTSSKIEHVALTKCSLLGAVEGGDTVEERRRSALETAKRPVDGFVLEGFDMTHNPDALQSVIQSTTEVLPNSKPRFIHGIYLLGNIFTAVECGVDVFDGSNVYTATERGHALTYPNQKILSHNRLHNEDTTPSNSMPPTFEINLNETKYAEDFLPIVGTCGCYCCQHHSRAYVHHLLQTKEILAGTLLMMHNLSHHMTFFANLRDAIRTSDAAYTHFKSSSMSCLSPEASDD